MCHPGDGTEDAEPPNRPPSFGKRPHSTPIACSCQVLENKRLDGTSPPAETNLAPVPKVPLTPPMQEIVAGGASSIMGSLPEPGDVSRAVRWTDSDGREYGWIHCDPAASPSGWRSR
jgi:hypothetical protein